MAYSFDGDSTVEQRHCLDCGQPHESVTGFVLLDDVAHAVYYADWYPHSQEAHIDVVLGSWDAPAYSDHVTFGCRVGYVEGQAEPAASLVQGGALRGSGPILGTKLDRAAALEHVWLAEFWAIVDWLIINDPTLHEHVYHLPAAD